MAFNAYLIFHKAARVEKGKGIFGESSSAPEDKAVGLGAIEIADYGFGVSMPVTSARSDGGGATVGRANFDVFTCSKGIDTATPYLVQYCCTGKNIPSIVLHLYRQGDDSASGVIKYAMMVFCNCVITKVGISGGGEELPKESLEFNYGFCEYWYQLTDHATGKKDSLKPLKYGWSTVSNKYLPSNQDFDAFDPADAPEGKS